MWLVLAEERALPHIYSFLTTPSSRFYSKMVGCTVNVDTSFAQCLNREYRTVIIKRTPAQSTKMRLCAFRESTFIEEQMYAVPICEHGCAT